MFGFQLASIHHAHASAIFAYQWFSRHSPEQHGRGRLSDASHVSCHRRHPRPIVFRRPRPRASRAPVPAGHWCVVCLCVTGVCLPCDFSLWKCFHSVRRVQFMVTHDKCRMICVHCPDVISLRLVLLHTCVHIRVRSQAPHTCRPTGRSAGTRCAAALLRYCVSVLL